ncbi:MAG: TonB-dependent receptor plug domain-containing protein, partial [Pseudomonadota bacterium]
MAQNIRNRRSNKCLQAALFAGVAAAPLLTVPAFAQEGDAADGLDTITVTAQRREENQQEVPISVSTLPEDRWRTFQTAGEDIRALAARIPGVYAESSNGRAAPRFYIRGLGNVDFDLAASQPVSIIVDEVVLENVLLKSTPIFDIEQVEVLRGPQGTLFGRNTPAGIIKFDTKKPTEEFDLYAQFAYGTLDTITGQFGVGGPIIEDLLSVRISGLAQTRGAYIDNAAPGFEQEDAFGDFEEFAGRAQVLVTPTDRLSVLLKGNIRTLEGTSALFRANIIEPGVGGLIENFDRETVFFDGGAGNRQEVDTWGVSGKIDIDFGAATLTSVTAFNSGTSNSRGDIDGGFVGPNSFFDTASPPAPPFGPDTIPFPSDTQDSIDDLDQFTQEVRIA